MAGVGALAVVAGVLLAPSVQATPSVQAVSSVPAAPSVQAAPATIAASSNATVQCWNPNSQYASTDPFVFGGVRLTAAQITAAQTISDVATARHLTDRATRIAIAAAMSASGLNPLYRNGSAVGLFAQQPAVVATASPVLADRSDPAAAARAFFGRLTVQVPGYQTDARTDAQLAALVSGRASEPGIAKYTALATQIAPVLTADTTTSTARISTLTRNLVAAASERSVGPAAIATGAIEQTLTLLLGSVLGGLVAAPPAPAADVAQVAPAQAVPAPAVANGQQERGYRLRGAPALVPVSNDGTDSSAGADTAGTESAGADTAGADAARTGTTGTGGDANDSTGPDGSATGAGPDADGTSGSDTALTGYAVTVVKTVITTLTDVVTVLVDQSGNTLSTRTSTHTAVETTTSTSSVAAAADSTTSADESTTVTGAPSTVTATTTVPPTPPSTTPPVTTTSPTTTAPTTTSPTTSTAPTSVTPPASKTTSNLPSPTKRTTPPKSTDKPSTSPTAPSTAGSPSGSSTPPKTTDHAPSTSTGTGSSAAKPPAANDPAGKPTAAPPSDAPANPDPNEQQPSFPFDPTVTPDPVDPHSTAVPAGTPATTVSNCLPAGGAPSQFDPGSIISDEVFYDTNAMTVGQITAFVDRLGAGCTGAWCLRSLVVDVPTMAQNRYCDAYAGGRQTAAQAIAGISAACGINPQVMLVTLQKEAGLLTRTDVTLSSWNAAWGWYCPDTGPGGSANCDPAHAGFVNQLYGMAQQWSRYKLDPGKYHYRAGQVADVMWNVKESGCGAGPVYIRNAATASLYNYTPYQPNAASLAAYPAAGDKCSSYGNRNFFVLFGKYFGGTGAGIAAATSVSGTVVTLPSGPNVSAGAAGQRIVAPNAAVARGIAAGLGAVGLPYVWGGGTNGGGPDQGCSRAGGSSNSCQGIVGFDCSGLTAFVLNQAGFSTGTDSGSQRAGGERVPWNQAQPGDIVGYPGHVAIFLGWINGVPYMLQAPSVGKQVQIRTVYTHNIDPVVHRYWR